MNLYAALNEPVIVNTLREVFPQSYKLKGCLSYDESVIHQNNPRYAFIKN